MWNDHWSIMKHYMFMKSRLHLPYHFEEHWIFFEKSLMLTILFWGALYIYEKISMLIFLFWGALYILKSRQCLPFYFGEHCIFMRSCLHLPFYHVRLRWRKSYNSFYNPNRPWFISLFHVLHLIITIISAVDEAKYTRQNLAYIFLQMSWRELE